MRLTWERLAGLSSSSRRSSS